jgi:hypothetical protein
MHSAHSPQSGSVMQPHDVSPYWFMQWRSYLHWLEQPSPPSVSPSSHSSCIESTSPFPQITQV